METHTHTLPSSWACYLINGDASGLAPEDQAAADRWLADHQDLGWPVDCQDAGFRHHHDASYIQPLAGDCQEYTFLVQG